MCLLVGNKTKTGKVRLGVLPKDLVGWELD
jgi:hypothetical protein